MKFNTSIAAMMEFINEWENKTLSKKNAKKFLQILAPFAPFITEEIWRNVFGEKTSIHLSTWPKVEGEIVEEELVIPIQVNGKLRGTLVVDTAKALGQASVEKMVKENQTISKYLSGTITKVIFVPGKLINFVVSSL